MGWCASMLLQTYNSAFTISSIIKVVLIWFSTQNRVVINDN